MQAMAHPSMLGAFAYDLASTVACLHSIGGGHGDLRSHNIIFHDNVSTGGFDYAEFYLSGFKFEQPIPDIDDTLLSPLGDVLYRHPDNQGYTPIFDPLFNIYNLGIILIELAY